MRIVFIGASRFGLRCLEALLSVPEAELMGIVIAPALFQISYRPEGVRNVLHADFGPIAHRLGKPVLELQDRMSAPSLVKQLRAFEPELFVVAGWYHKIPDEIRAIAPCVGLHASLLPDYSGGAPLVWAMIHGERETGITLFMMDSGMDSGPIVGQAREPILPEDTIATLYARIEEQGIALLREHLPRLAAGTATLQPQDDSRRRVFPQRGPEDGRIDWEWPARRVHDFVRAQTRPYPGAFTSVTGERLTVWRSRPAPGGQEAIAPGTCVDLDRSEGPVVQCGERTLLAIEEAESRAGVMHGRELGAWLAARARTGGGPRLGT
jgi:methionyl-tRNA formyltransferase